MEFLIDFKKVNIKTSKGFVEKVEFYSDNASLVNIPA